ncbi:MAG TPA: hypothetical protein VLF94_07490 [Chlamydiales bacterium]|nr:hypothetical protein [Chlamydiales bacterium]
MRLTDLDPQFLKYDIRVEEYSVVNGVWDPDKKDYVVADGRYWHDAGEPVVKKTGPRTYLIPVATLAEAQLISFLCPKCRGLDGEHHVHMPFADRGVDHELVKNQWNVKGSSFEDLSTTPSYLIIGGCGWHGYITDGNVSII